MTNKFPFNHFLKLDGLSESPAAKRGEVNPVIIEETLKTLNVSKESKSLSAEFGTEELKTITDALLENIKSLINPNKFHAYFANAFTVSAIRQDLVEIVVTTNFIKKMVETHYPETIKQALHEILGKDYGVEIQVLGAPSLSMSSNNENILNTIKGKKPETTKNPTFFIDELQPTKDDLYKAIDSQVIEHQTANSSNQIDINKTFSNFIIGPSNNIAHALSLAVAKDPGKSYPALYIYGNSGLGKTHLIHAIANHVQIHKPNMRICITSANRFMNEMVDCIVKKNQSIEFKKKYIEQTDLLIIDDIHELKNKTTTH